MANHNMKIVKIIGGLGNQMFQYVFYLWLHEYSEDTVLIDISAFENYDLHNGMEINSTFMIDFTGSVASLAQINKLKDQKRFFKMRRKIGKLFCKNPNVFLSETHYYEPLYCGFFCDLFQKNDTYFEGYWQNEKYIQGCQKNDIKKLFVWNNLSKQTQFCANNMRNEFNSVSIHIRNRDRLKKWKHLLYYMRLRLVWRECEFDYYIKAVEEMKSRVNSPKFYVFTNDIEWAKSKVLKTIEEDIMIVDWNKGIDSNQDMYLMTQCKHNIISMSSFSWWGAWLNTNPDKIVISPKKWAIRFNKCIDIIPKEWIKI
jgi:hypothetical protein